MGTESVFLQDLVFDSHPTRDDLLPWQELTLWSAVAYGFLALLRIFMTPSNDVSETDRIESPFLLDMLKKLGDDLTTRSASQFYNDRSDQKNALNLRWDPRSRGFFSKRGDNRGGKGETNYQTRGKEEEYQSRMAAEIEMRMMKKQILVRESAAQFIEMAYWIIKFVGDFEKSRGNEGSSAFKNFHWFKETSTAILKYARYVVKFISSYQKLIN